MALAASVQWSYVSGCFVCVSADMLSADGPGILLVGVYKIHMSFILTNIVAFQDTDLVSCQLNTTHCTVMG